MRLRAGVTVKSNLELTLRERGKLVTRRKGHNIWLNLGREWLANLICYANYTPLTPEEDNRIRYMGLGIGGTRQLAPGVANAEPYLSAYSGTLEQTDTDASVTRLERPVRLSGGSTAYPGASGDVWLGQVQLPVTHVTATQSVFKRLFTQTEISYNPFLAAPLSEVMLFTNAANPAVYNNVGVAYDTFDTITKTSAFDLEIVWAIRF